MRRLETTVSHLAPATAAAKTLVLPGMQGRVAIVNAAAQGIGQGICECLAQQGVHVVLVDLASKEAEADQRVRWMQARGVRAVFLSCDVTQRKQIEAVFEAAIDWALPAKLSISVSVVGGGERKPFLEQTEESYHRTIGLTQHAHWHWQQVAAQQMSKTEGGSLVLIGSIMSQMNREDCMAYQAGKAAVASMGRTMAHELARYNIRVNVVQPGYIDTPGERTFATEEQIANWPILFDIPAKRLGTSADIGNAVTFLCSSAASYITGSVIDVDGGYLSAMGLPPRKLGLYDAK